MENILVCLDDERLQQQVFLGVSRIADGVAFAAGAMHLIACVQRHGLGAVQVDPVALFGHFEPGRVGGKIMDFDCDSVVFFCGA